MPIPDRYAPPFSSPSWSKQELFYLKPFFTNTSESVYAPLIPSPEFIGALCSRTSRAPQDLRGIFINEYVTPFLEPKREETDDNNIWAEKQAYADSLRKLFKFLDGHSLAEVFSNPRARAFYVKWLAEYGDDSIAQMAGSHLVFWGISQPAIKHLENQRIALAPIEKSTRYVDFSRKVNGQYMYYVSPDIEDLGLVKEYRSAMDGLFETYTVLLPRMQKWLSDNFPEEKPNVIKTKAFDVLRGLLPCSTLSQVAFFGNGQSFEYAVNRSARHPLGEVRWIAQRIKDELEKVTPSFFRRIDSEANVNYQEYIAKRSLRMAAIAPQVLGEVLVCNDTGPQVKLIDYDHNGENKIICGMLYDSAATHLSWDEILETVIEMPRDDKRRIIATYFEGRSERWQKVGRALENAYVRFEITMNIGAWRDLHRHRMLTQQYQQLSCHHGYDIPMEIIGAGFDTQYRQAMGQAENIFAALEIKDPFVAQYAPTLAHRVRFQQLENIREFFWETELRTIPAGHVDYRRIEQEKFRLLSEVYPLLASFAKVDMNDYDFARRGQEERSVRKLQKLEGNS